MGSPVSLGGRSAGGSEGKGREGRTRRLLSARRGPAVAGGCVARRPPPGGARGGARGTPGVGVRPRPGTHRTQRCGNAALTASCPKCTALPPQARSREKRKKKPQVSPVKCFPAKLHVTLSRVRPQPRELAAGSSRTAPVTAPGSIPRKPAGGSGPGSGAVPAGSGAGCPRSRSPRLQRGSGDSAGSPAQSGPPSAPPHSLRHTGHSKSKKGFLRDCRNHFTSLTFSVATCRRSQRCPQRTQSPRPRWKFLPGKGSSLLCQGLGTGFLSARTPLCCLYSRNAALPRKKVLCTIICLQREELQQRQLCSPSQRRTCPGSCTWRKTKPVLLDCRISAAFSAKAQTKSPDSSLTFQYRSGSSCSTDTAAASIVEPDLEMM
ncbi:uncharacterized protein FYW23_012967 [Sylvia borin]